MERGFVLINHIVDIQNFFLSENMSCLMVAAAVGPVGTPRAGRGAGSDAWSPRSSWMDRGPGALGGLIAQALQDETMKREDLCVRPACGTHGPAGPAVLKIPSPCRHEPRER